MTQIESLVGGLLMSLLCLPNENMFEEALAQCFCSTNSRISLTANELYYAGTTDYYLISYLASPQHQARVHKSRKCPL